MAKIKNMNFTLPKETILYSAVTDSEGNVVLQFSRDCQIKIPVSQLVSTEDMNYRSKSTQFIVPQIRYGYPRREEKKVEKRFTMPNNLFKAIDFTEMGIVEAEDNYDSMPRFIIGEKYALTTPGCDGFAGSEKIYKLIGIHDEYGGVKVDSLIVKQISGEVGNIYTLSKNDCEHIGIEYEAGLQLFPKTMSWVHVKDVIDFDEHNLATTPRSDVDNTIRHIVLKLEGFSDYSDGYVLSPSGKLIKEEQFERSIMVESNEPIVYGNGVVVPDHKPLDAYIVHPSTKLFTHGNFISSEDEVFIYIQLKKHDVGYGSFDNCYGVDPKYLDGVNPNEFFTITWDELGGLTVEEYEDIKRKKAEAEAERIRQEEEARKRQIEEAEKAEAEKRRLEELAIERMKKFKINQPSDVKMPRFNMELDPIVGIDKYIDDLDDYFKAVDAQLITIDEALLRVANINPYRRGSLVDFLDER